MKVIYMQDTIDYIIQTNPSKISDVEKLGDSDKVDMFNDKDQIIGQYHKFKV